MSNALRSDLSALSEVYAAAGAHPDGFAAGLAAQATEPYRQALFCDSCDRVGRRFDRPGVACERDGCRGHLYTMRQIDIRLEARIEAGGLVASREDERILAEARAPEFLPAETADVNSVTIRRGWLDRRRPCIPGRFESSHQMGGIAPSSLGGLRRAPMTGTAR